MEFINLKCEVYKNLTLGKSISLYDGREYENGKDNNGGRYSFTVDFINLGNYKAEIKYSTSSDFGYCEVCGNFTNSQNGSCSNCHSYELKICNYMEIADLIVREIGKNIFHLHYGDDYLQISLIKE